MSSPKSLSVIIPVFNEEDYIGACLDALATQTVPPTEVIVVDNNSTDATLDIVRRYPFVKVIQETQQGVVHARDCGFNEAASDLIGRIDADTLLPADWVASVQAIMHDDTIHAATGPVCYYDMPFTETNYRLDHMVRLSLYRGAPHMPFLFGSNMVIRRDTWQSLRHEVCRSKQLHEDLDLAIHLMEQNRHISYERQMLASTSSRRYDDDIGRFAHYMEVFRNTYQLHGIRSIAPVVATGIYWLGYLTLYPLRRSYDPKTGQRNLKNLAKKSVSRPHPM